MEKVTGDDISKLLGSIKAVSCKAEDKHIIEMVGNWIPSYNCEAAADGFLEVIPIIISSRPHLEYSPNVYMGITESKQVFAWANFFLKNERNSLSEECVAWLAKEAIIMEIIEEIQKDSLTFQATTLSF